MHTHTCLLQGHRALPSGMVVAGRSFSQSAIRVSRCRALMYELSNIIHMLVMYGKSNIITESQRE